MLYRALFLCDYERFRVDAQPFVDLADKGDYAPIILRAKEIAKFIPYKKWILHDLGTTLRGFVDTPPTEFSRSHVIGFSFLVLLGQYLTRLPIDTPKFGLTAIAVESLGWDERDVKLLTRGAAMTALLKPAMVPDILERPGRSENWNNPAYYWWWLRPANAFHTGWWSTAEAQRLGDMLRKSKVRFEEMEIKTAEDFPNAKPQDKEEILHDFDNMIDVFNLAVDQKIGLLALDV